MERINRIINVLIVVSLAFDVYECLKFAINGDFKGALVEYAWMVCLILIVFLRIRQGNWFNGENE